MHSLLPALAAYLPRDRVESLLCPDHALSQEGVALIADISGFTALTEALAQQLSPDEGAEVLTRALDSIFTPLIAEIHAFRGSVIKFGGDALIVWYGQEPYGTRVALARRALTSAWRMQQVMRAHGQLQTPIGPIRLRMKIGMSSGPVQRLNLGSPEHGFEDVFVGATVDRMAEAEHHAEPGEVILDAATQVLVGQAAQVAEWRDDFAVVGALPRPARRRPWPALSWEPAEEPALIQRFAAYLPAALYETLRAGRTQVAELKPVVSLFVQFHGLAYDQDPESAAKLQRYFEAAQQIVARYEGRLNRLITGDKGNLLHIIFGAPRTVEEQEARAIRCALELQIACGGLPFITMQRIGVAAGRAFAGPVGSPERHDYTTMGDIINLSARLMQSAADHQILLERTVRSALGPEFQVEPLGSIHVKGKSESISIFAVLGVTQRLRRASPQLALPLFGRDKELAALHAQVAGLARGRGQAVVLLGEVGMGKTLLLDTLHQQAEVPWAGGICLAYGQSLSGHLFVGLLRDLLRLPAGAGPDESLAALAALCADLFGTEQGESAYLYLARFMGLPLDETQAQSLEGISGESFRWRLFEIIQGLFRRFLARQSLVLALDDLQWADATSLHLIERLLPLVGEFPLLLLLSLRPDSQSRAWALYQRLNPGSYLGLPLRPLDEPAALMLVRHFVPQLPSHLLTPLLDKAGGNPLFLVELLHMLQVKGLLENPETLAGVPIEALDLPDSIQGLLLAQIDCLAVEARHTLQLAAVIGRRFFYQLLDAISAEAERLDEHLATLQAQSYIHPDPQPSDLGRAYLFRHSLIQESAYSTLLYERRRDHHRAVAEALEQRFPTLIGEQAGMLAFHYEHAGDLAQALYFHLHAADQARLLYANEEAEALYRKALALLEQQEAERGQPDPERRAALYLRLAQLRTNLLDFEAAQLFYDQAFEYLERVRPPARPHRPAQSKAERTFRLGISLQGMGTADPALSEVGGEAKIIEELFEGLVELDPELNVIPAVARRWQVDQGGRRYRLELRSNLQWSDGQPLTAHDFVFAWRRNLDPQTDSAVAHLLYIVEGAEAFHQGELTDPEALGIRALDDWTLEIALRAPCPYFLYLLAASCSFPQPAHLIREKGAAWQEVGTLVGNGPFIVTKDETDIYLEQNRFYRGMFPGNLERVYIHPIKPDLEAFQRQEIDWCRIEEQHPEPTKDETVFLLQHLSIFFLAFACRCIPQAWRQLFAATIDQKALVREVWNDVQKAATGGMIPPGMIAHSPELPPAISPKTIPARLAQVRDRVALPNPLILAALPGCRTTPHHLRQRWRAMLDVDVTIIEEMPIDELLSGFGAGKVHLALLGWEAEYPDPDNVLRILFHGESPNNYLGWRSDAFDRAVTEAAVATDIQQRLLLYRRAEQILVQKEAAAVPLYYQQSYGLLRQDFKLKGANQIIRGDWFKLKYVQHL